MKLILFFLFIAWAIAIIVNPYILGWILIMIAFVSILILEKALRPKKKNVFIHSN